MSDAATIALIAAVPPTLAAILGYLANRSVRRAIATGNELPIGALVERIEARVESVAANTEEIGRRVARLEGRTTMPLQLRRRIDTIGDEVHTISERVARLEAKETGT